MFDYFKVFDKDIADNIKCHYGHSFDVGHEFQTKDMDSALIVYGIKDYKLQQFSHPLVGEREDFDPVSINDYTGHVGFYDACEKCKSIVYEAVINGQKYKQSYSLWVEYKAVFRRGELLFIDPVKLETREEALEYLTKAGCTILSE